MNYSLFRLSPHYFFHEANRDGGNANGESQSENNQDQGGNNGSDAQNFATFDEWYKSLNDDQKKLFEAGKQHFDKVYSTLSTVRSERDDFSAKLRDAIKQLKDGPDKTRFEELTGELDEANRRADFYEEAPAHQCTNSKAAFLIAKSLDLFNKKGEVDWQKLAAEAPEFFGQKRTLPRKQTAGNGTGGQPPSSQTMNDWIRRQAGRNVITQDQ